MFIYTVTLNINTDVHDEWLKWMKEKHLPDVMATGCFKTYSMYRLLSPEPDEGVTYIINYECNTIEDYERYKIEHAAILQNEHKEKFGNTFIAVRSFMEKL